MKILFFKFILFILCIHFILNYIISKRNKQYILKLIMKNEKEYNDIKKKLKKEKYIHIKYYKKKRTIRCWIYNNKMFNYINHILQCK